MILLKGQIYPLNL